MNCDDTCRPGRAVAASARARRAPSTRMFSELPRTLSNILEHLENSRTSPNILEHLEHHDHLEYLRRPQFVKTFPNLPERSLKTFSEDPL